MTTVTKTLIGEAEINKALMKEVSRMELQLQNMDAKLEESVAFGMGMLEIDMDMDGWWRVSGNRFVVEFQLQYLRWQCDSARLMYFKSPLIKRAVDVQTQYVIGQGVKWSAEREDVQQVIEGFWTDPRNQREIFSQEALSSKERSLQLFSNLFILLFHDPETGNVQVRSVPMIEIDKIYTDPDDIRDVLLYKRVYASVGPDGKAGLSIRYYRDIWADPEEAEKFYDTLQSSAKLTATGEEVGIEENVVCLHVSVNKLDDMMFGVSEVFSALPWARAYKQFLEDWAKITKSLSRWAWQVTSGNGSAGVSSLASKFAATTVVDNVPNLQVGPEAGSVYVSTKDQKIEPIKTQGATVSMDDARRLALMVSSATGIYEPYLMGDPSTGNLATAKSMERPMEIMFKDRQTLLADTLRTICLYAITKAAEAGQIKNVTTGDVDWLPREEGGDKAGQVVTVSVRFPDILERDTLQRVQAIISAATMDGKQFAGTLGVRKTAEMMAEALGIDNVQQVIADLMPAGWKEPTGADLIDKAMQPPEPQWGGGFGGGSKFPPKDGEEQPADGAEKKLPFKTGNDAIGEAFKVIHDLRNLIEAKERESAQ